MSSKDGLHRRKIRSGLKRDHGWDVQSHVAGTLSVWPPSASLSAAEFRHQVVDAVRALGYQPTVIATTDDKGHTCIRFHTPETLAQEGRGGHGHAG